MKSIWFGSNMVGLPPNLANDLLSAASKAGGRPSIKFTREGFGNTAKYFVQGVHKINVTPALYTLLAKSANITKFNANGGLTLVTAVASSQPGWRTREEAAKPAAVKAPQPPKLSSGSGKTAETKAGSTPLPSDYKYPITQVGTTAQKPPPPDHYVESGGFTPSTPEDISAAAEIVESGVDPTEEGMSTTMKAGLAVGGLVVMGGAGYFIYTKYMK